MLNSLFDKRSQRKLSPTSSKSEDYTVFQERPKICLVDIDTNAEEALVSAGFNCTTGSLGSSIKLTNSKIGDACTCRLNNSLPPNLHEYDIIIIDLKDREPTQYDPSQHRPQEGIEASRTLFACMYPQTIFDPKPLSAHSLRTIIKEIQRKQSIVVVFATNCNQVTYYPTKLTTRGYSQPNPFIKDNYSFLPSRVIMEDKHGEKTIVAEENEKIADFLQKYNQEFVYDIVFRHPTNWIEGKAVKESNFIPLIVNASDEIVAYAQVVNELSVVLVFPQLEDKTSFLVELFQKYLPAIVPDLFPFSTEFAWLADHKYQLPNEVKLLAEKQAIEQEYNEKLIAKEHEIHENHQQFQFLHDLLTETGEKLVKTVERYLHWLEFDSIVNCDEAYLGKNEEDLQVSVEGGLLVMEVKGIGGTSKDRECSQISKIKYRRAKERGSFDVFALYIVNHQRYLPPENRSNPPFTPEQIRDAENDERGLLSTYDLFKLYFAIMCGCITKKDARNSFLDYGLVEFKPSNAVAIGKPLEIHHNGTVGIFLLRGITIRQGEELLIYEYGHCRVLQVVSLKDQDKDVTEASEGEIGIKFSDSITKESELWKPTMEVKAFAPV